MSALKMVSGKTGKKENGKIDTYPKRIDMEQRANDGRPEDIDYLMSYLFKEQTFAICKLVDFVLSLVTTFGGRKRIKYYLFNGNRVQRNYAALYFKRLGNHKRLLKTAVENGCIDKEQAYSA